MSARCVDWKRYVYSAEKNSTTPELQQQQQHLKKLPRIPRVRRLADELLDVLAAEEVDDRQQQQQHQVQQQQPVHQPSIGSSNSSSRSGYERDGERRRRDVPDERSCISGSVIFPQNDRCFLGETQIHSDTSPLSHPASSSSHRLPPPQPRSPNERQSGGFYGSTVGISDNNDHCNSGSGGAAAAVLRQTDKQQLQSVGSPSPYKSGIHARRWGDISSKKSSTNQAGADCSGRTEQSFLFPADAAVTAVGQPLRGAAFPRCSSSSINNNSTPSPGAEAATTTATKAPASSNYDFQKSSNAPPFLENPIKQQLPELSVAAPPAVLDSSSEDGKLPSKQKMIVEEDAHGATACSAPLKADIGGESTASSQASMRLASLHVRPNYLINTLNATSSPASRLLANSIELHGTSKSKASSSNTSRSSSVSRSSTKCTDGGSTSTSVSSSSSSRYTSGITSKDERSGSIETSSFLQRQPEKKRRRLVKLHISPRSSEEGGEETKDDLTIREIREVAYEGKSSSSARVSEQHHKKDMTLENSHVADAENAASAATAPGLKAAAKSDAAAMASGHSSSDLAVAADTAAGGAGNCTNSRETAAGKDRAQDTKSEQFFTPKTAACVEAAAPCVSTAGKQVQQEKRRKAAAGPPAEATDSSDEESISEESSSDEEDALEALQECLKESADMTARIVHAFGGGDLKLQASVNEKIGRGRCYCDRSYVLPAELHQPQKGGAAGAAIFEKLKEYQKCGVHWLLTLFEANRNGILADEMGLGKTAQTCVFLNHLYASRLLKSPSIIAAPASLLDNWVEELKKWAPYLYPHRVVKYHGKQADRRRLALSLLDAYAQQEEDSDDAAEADNNSGNSSSIASNTSNSSGNSSINSNSSGNSNSSSSSRGNVEGSSSGYTYGSRSSSNGRNSNHLNGSSNSRSSRRREEKLRVCVLVTSLNTLTSNWDLQYLRQIRPLAYLVVDEAHSLKNRDSRVYRKLNKTLKFDRRLLLTGSPIQNRTAELRNLLLFLMPSIFDGEALDLALKAFYRQRRRHTALQMKQRRLLTASPTVVSGGALPAAHSSTADAEKTAATIIAETAAPASAGADEAGEITLKAAVCAGSAGVAEAEKLSEKASTKASEGTQKSDSDSSKGCSLLDALTKEQRHSSFENLPQSAVTAVPAAAAADKMSSRSCFLENEESRERRARSAEVECLQQILSPFILRRLKCEVLADLPKKISVVLRCEMRAKQKQLYVQQICAWRSELTRSLEKFTSELTGSDSLTAAAAKAATAAAVAAAVSATAPSSKASSAGGPSAAEAALGSDGVALERKKLCENEVERETEETAEKSASTATSLLTAKTAPSQARGENPLEETLALPAQRATESSGNGCGNRRKGVLSTQEEDDAAARKPGSSKKGHSPFEKQPQQLLHQEQLPHRPKNVAEERVAAEQHAQQQQLLQEPTPISQISSSSFAGEEGRSSRILTKVSKDNEEISATGASPFKEKEQTDTYADISLSEDTKGESTNATAVSLSTRNNKEDSITEEAPLINACSSPPPKTKFVNSLLFRLRRICNHPVLMQEHYTPAQLQEVAQHFYLRVDGFKGNPLEKVKAEIHKWSDYEIHQAIRQQLLQGDTTLQHLLLSKETLMNSAKLRKMFEIVNEIRRKGEKMLIFSQYTTFLDVIEECLSSYGEGVSYCRLDGSTAVEERQAMVEQFNNEPSVTLFLLSTKAGGQGLNLTAATTVVLMDQDWNPHNDRQAEDRVHRLGQTRDVTIYRLCCRGTVEESILKCCQAKLDLDVAFGGNYDLLQAAILQDSLVSLEKVVKVSNNASHT